MNTRRHVVTEDGVNRSLINWLLIVFGAFFAVAIMAQDDGVIEETISADAPPPEPACFSIRNITNYRALNNQFLLIEGRQDNNYLLTLGRACFGVRNADNIAISNHTDRVCANSQAKVTYARFGEVDECMITQIESVADRETAEMLVERRRQQN